MVEISSRLKSVADRGKWNARGASFVTKLKATKVVWFPPTPVETGTKAAATAQKATANATTKSTGAAKKSTGAAAKKTTGAAKKTTGAAKKATGATGKKKTAKSTT